MTAQSLPEFFGAPVEEVNSLFVAMLAQDDTLPGWCRGRSSIGDAPRYVPVTKVETGWYRADIDFLGLPEIAQRMRWIVERLNGPWSLRFNEDIGVIDNEQGFIFQKRSDAVQYAMRWRGTIIPV